MKVNAGGRLLMAEARVGELYSIPLNAHILPPYLLSQTQIIHSFSYNQTIKKEKEKRKENKHISRFL